MPPKDPLTVAQLLVDGGGSCIILGCGPEEIPPALAELLHELVALTK